MDPPWTVTTPILVGGLAYPIVAGEPMLGTVIGGRVRGTSRAAVVGERASGLLGSLAGPAGTGLPGRKALEPWAS